MKKIALFLFIAVSAIFVCYPVSAMSKPEPVSFVNNFTKPLLGYIPAYGDYVYPQWFSNPYGYPNGLQYMPTGCLHSLYQYYSEWVGKRCKSYGVSNVDGVYWVTIGLANNDASVVTCKIDWPLNEKDQFGNITIDYLVKTN